MDNSLTLHENTFTSFLFLNEKLRCDFQLVLFHFLLQSIDTDEKSNVSLSLKFSLCFCCSAVLS